MKMDLRDDIYEMIFKLVIIGDSGVGKTGIINRYLHNTFSHEIKATIGVEFGTQKINLNGHCIKAQIWDTAGQERYRSITNAYYKGAKAAIIVYDITNLNSFVGVERWLKEIRAVGDKDIHLVLVGNKSDLDVKRQVPTDKGEEYARINEIAFMETSALNSSNITKVFESIAERVYKMRNKEEIEDEEEFDDLENKGNIMHISMNQSPPPEKKCCEA